MTWHGRYDARKEPRGIEAPARLLALVLFLSLAVSTAVVMVMRPAVITEFERVEADEVTRDVERANKMFDVHLKRLSGISVDWAQWDDAAHFAQGVAPDFPDINLQPQVLRNLNIDGFVFFDKTGKPFHSVRLRPSRETTERVPDEVLSAFASHDKLIGLAEASDRGFEIVSTPRGVMLASAAGITSSDLRLPILGTVVVFQEVDERLITEIEEHVRLDVRADIDATGGLGDARLVAASKRLNPKHTVEVTPLGAHEVGAVQFVFDDDGAPVFVLGVVEDRPVYWSGRRVANTLTIIIFVGGLFLGMASTLLVEVAARRRTAHELDYLVGHDYLTNLPNLRSFQRSLEREFARVARTGGSGAVLWLDLDNFKVVNDTLGHHIGDQLLSEMGRLLARAVRDGDEVARIGGDEFAVLLPSAVRVEALVVARRILDELRKAPFNIEGHSVFARCSMGVVVFPEDGTTYDLLLARADIAMYDVKRRGGSACGMYIEPDQGGDLGEYGDTSD